MSNLMLDVGCGNRCREGYEGIDKIYFENNKHTMNVELEPLPYDDNVVDEIYCNHMLEHIQNLIFVLNEFHRVLKPSGKLEIGVPLVGAYGSGGVFIFGNGAYTDITHCRYFSQDSFFCLEKGFIGNTDIGLKGYFKILKREIMVESKPNGMLSGVNMNMLMEKVL